MPTKWQMSSSHTQMSCQRGLLWTLGQASHCSYALFPSQVLETSVTVSPVSSYFSRRLSAESPPVARPISTCFSYGGASCDVKRRGAGDVSRLTAGARGCCGDRYFSDVQPAKPPHDCTILETAPEAFDNTRADSPFMAGNTPDLRNYLANFMETFNFVSQISPDSREECCGNRRSNVEQTVFLHKIYIPVIVYIIWQITGHIWITLPIHIHIDK